jgi:Ca2+/Na+ antiporter
VNITAWIVGFLFLCFCVLMVWLTVRSAKQDAEEKRRRIHRMLNEMPRSAADRWLRNQRKGPRCACGIYNLKYTDTVKANEADHQLLRCQPARERIEIKNNDWDHTEKEGEI